MFTVQITVAIIQEIIFALSEEFILNVNNTTNNKWKHRE